MARLAGALGVSLSELFISADVGNGLVRENERVRITYGDNRFWDEILSPSTSGKLLMLRSTILPGADSGPAYSHAADEECVVILSGVLDLQVGGERLVLGEGDSLTFDSHRPHAWHNSGDVPVVAIWAITPPIF